MSQRDVRGDERTSARRRGRSLVSRRELLAATGTATVLGVAGAGVATAAGDEYYATPDGAGAEDGSSWENAVSGSAISDFVDEEMGAGDTLYVGSGEYESRITVSSGGSDGNPIVIEGVDRGDGKPVFRGSWTTDDRSSGNFCVTLGAEASHVEVRHLEIRNWKGGVLTSSGGVNEHVVIDDVDSRDVYNGFFLQDFRNSTIANSDVVFHMKQGFRFQEGCRDLEVVNCFTDQNEGDFDRPRDFPFGFMIWDGRGPNDQRDITFRRCEARHCQWVPNDGTYWNGDGFVVENEHPGVEFYDCIAYANQDGGWDDKGVGSYYENCIAVANGRNFRCWDSAEYNNCLSVNGVVRGGSSPPAGMWAQGDATLNNVTFHNNDGVVIDGKVTANDCLFASGDPEPDSGSGNVADSEPEFKAPDPDYDGQPRDAYNSQKYGPDVGFWLDVDRTAPSAPGNLTASDYGYLSVDLEWDESTDEGGSGLDHYVVYVDGEAEAELPAGTTATTVSELSPGTSYDFRVTAVDWEGNESDPSETVTVETKADSAAPSVPANLSAPSKDFTTVDLTWDAASDDDSGLDHYVVYVDGEADHEVAADATSTTVTGLEDGSSFEFEVTAVDLVGNESPTSNAVTVETNPDDEAPTVPGDVTAERSDTRVGLSWAASSDQGGVGVARYDLYLDGEKEREVPADATNAVVSGLETETTYEVGIAAVDAVGNESERATESVTTTASGIAEAYYPFDESAGASTAADATGLGRDAEIGDGVTAGEDGYVGSAYAFDGSDSAVVTDPDADVYLNGKSALTLAAWVKAAETGGDGGIFATEPGAVSPGHPTLRYDGDGFAGGGNNVLKGGVQVTTGDEVGPDAEDTTTATMETVSDLQTTEWQHVALAWRAGKAPAIYVDGTEAEYSDEPDTTSEDARIATTQSLRIGGDVKAGSFWNGKIDDVRVYGRRLSEDEIATLAAGESLETPTPTPTETDEPTESESPTDAETTDGSGPGPGVGGALASVLSAGYLLKRRVAGGPDADPEE